MVALLAMLVNPARAEELGSHPHRDGTVHLSTQPCRAQDPDAGQQARQTVRGRARHGCWRADHAGNPIVVWSDGSELALDGRKVKLSPAMAGLLAPRAPAPSAGFPKPSWCPQARFPHERLICADPELSDRDLQLASSWRDFRRTLGSDAQANYRRDYFRRLKECGAEKACIAGAQEAQLRHYREALSR